MDSKIITSQNTFEDNTKTILFLIKFKNYLRAQFIYSACLLTPCEKKSSSLSVDLHHSRD